MNTRSDALRQARLRAGSSVSGGRGCPAVRLHGPITWGTRKIWCVRLFAVLGLLFAVAFLPLNAWADTASPTSTATDTSTASASSSSPASSAPTSTASSSSTAAPSSPAGTQSDPLYVSLDAQWMAVFLLVGVLLVFLLAVLVVSSWGA
jgi:hypothetical protein